MQLSYPRAFALLMLFAALGCGPPADPEVDAGDPNLCRAASDCSDGVFCNGAESCDPAHPTADANGCVAGAPPCGARACDETTAMCTEGCAPADADRDGDGVASIACGGDDCDDTRADRYPGNVEVCDPDGLDEDCDATTLGNDEDGDGLVGSECCNVTASGIRCGDDCDDTQSSVNPGGTEVCNGVDEDCDGFLDEGVFELAYPDVDGDGFGSTGAGRERECDGDPLFASQPGDCDDSDAAVNPGAVEVCDGRDNDCDGDAGDEVDIDGDGFLDARSTCMDPAEFDCDDLNPTAFPGAPEQCNDVDDNCDGVLDERVGAMPGFGADDFCAARLGDGSGFCANTGSSHGCVISACSADRADCDGNTSNGCEVDLSTDSNNCGGCAVGCDGVCTDGLCGTPNDGAVVDIVLGRNGGCVLRELAPGSGEGTVDCWGEVWFVPLPARPTPVRDDMGAPVDDARALAASRSGVFIVRGAARTLWSVGEGNLTGLLTEVAGLPAPIATVTSGEFATCAISGAGAMFCWEAGDAPAAQFAGEVFTSVQAGQDHACALREDGVLVCWGRNDAGQAGAAPSGDVTRQNVSAGAGQRFASVSIGASHTCATVESNGELRCWGSWGENFEEVAPSAPPVIASGVSQHGSGASLTCAHVGGEVRCFGREAIGSGVGLACGAELYARVDAEEPCDDLEPAGQELFCQEAACFVPDDGPRAVRVGVLDVPPVSGGGPPRRLHELSGVTHLVVHDGRACAVVADADVYCWGENGDNELATGGPDQVRIATPQRGRRPAADASLGRLTACARTSEGTIRCAGLEDGTFGPVPNQLYLTPVRVSVGVDDARQLNVGEGTACAVRADGTVACWGGVLAEAGDIVPLGDGSPFGQGSVQAVTVAGISDAAEVRVAFSHACARTRAGDVHCWGSNEFGALGAAATSTCGSVPCALSPVAVPLPAPAAEIAVGGFRVGDRSDRTALGAHTCARLVDGRVFCWGDNGGGALGTGDLLRVDTPTHIGAGVVDETVSLATSETHTCAVQASGRVYCWGALLLEAPGEAEICFLGISCIPRPYLVPVLADAVDVEVGLGGSCALREDGSITCWGTDDSGDGSGTAFAIPSSRVALPAEARSVHVRSELACATLHTGDVYCWGEDRAGAHGDGVQHAPLSTINPLVPEAMLGL